MQKKLVPLRIPSGWAVIRDFFGDEDPIVHNGMITNDEFYKEDLLLIKPILFDGTWWIIDRSGISLDLGWYPDADPDGSYRLVLIQDDWNTVIMSFWSKDRQTIRAVIERCLDLITQGIDNKQISRQIEIEYSSRDPN